MTLSTVLFTATRLIKAGITGAITGAKDAVLLEKQFMAWESELETLEVFDGYQGWIQQDGDRYEQLEREHLGNPYDETGIYARDCINCDGLFKTPRQGELMCDICLSSDEQIDELPDFLKEDDDILNSYHMDNCSYEATGTCDCDLPF